ncbi:MAG: asparagine synthase (glutamine-hydrolyzing) [Armatimonadetes bacterium]|nr:asparagine synthase (glutamine-hydrolyzing) [Armatimonadota bacterium]MDE2207878.1 asparagine synthase (glutamine-hydrolyzing) [Armatimonadota bacterium]
MDAGPVSPARTEAMTAQLAYRGPDGMGVATGPGYSFGHRRLSIIDRTEASAQPMSDSASQTVLTYNGEIYNYRDLRSELVKRGATFRSEGDAEVLINGYLEWGLAELLQRVRGMFAFALLDRRDHSLHLVRDPVGKKPLFYHQSEGEVVFASSALALVAGLGYVPDVDPIAVDELLWNTYIPAPRSIFVGVEKVPPATAVSISTDGDTKSSVYWQCDFGRTDAGIDLPEWMNRTEEAITTAIRRRFVADVPVGITLSGGIDSGLAVALASQAVGRVSTYTIQTEDKVLDESDRAAMVAKRYGTDHHVLLIEADMRNDLPSLVNALGEPLGDSSAANLFMLAKIAKPLVSVLLTGDGGDETFGGYGAMYAGYMGNRIGRWLRGPLRPMGLMLAGILDRAPGAARRGGTLMRYASLPPEQTFGRTSIITDQLRTELLTSDMLARVGEHTPWLHYDETLASTKDLPLDARVMDAYFNTILPGDLLQKADCSTMAVGLEARSPYLDLDVISLAQRMPGSVRFHGGQKGLLRTIARKYLPAEIVDHKKQGFGAPFAHWLRNEWTDLVDEFVCGPTVEERGWVRRESLERVLASFRAGGPRGPLLWTLLILELWLRRAAEIARTSPATAGA